VWGGGWVGVSSSEMESYTKSFSIYYIENMFENVYDI
jgi:hypothetical protein